MLIGIDVGTTAVKAALFDHQGHALKTFKRQYTTRRPAPGHVEQDAMDWLNPVLEALSQFDESNIVAVGLCSQVNTHVFVDAQGKPLLPAFTWQDGRCAEEAAKLDAQVSEDEKLHWWGAPLPIDASHVLARMAYVARHFPDIWQRTRWVMAPKDFCLFHLTGEAVTDPMTAFGIVDSNLDLVPRLLNLVHGAAERLPELSGFTKVIGRIGKGLPCADVPVVTGAMDAWSGLLGAGVSEDGQGLYLSGTSEILGIVSSRRTPVPGVIAFPKCEGIVLHAGPTQSGGASVEWVAKLLNCTASEISELASRIDLSKPVPVFLPHLEGERAPLWDINARASLSGLSSSMGAEEVARAVLEGVCFSARLVMDSLELSAGLRPSEINHSGGGAISDIWCQIRADVLNRPIRRLKMLDAGVLGAALMAGTGIGIFGSLHEAAKKFVLTDRVFEPNLTLTGRYDEGYAKYKSLYRQLVPWHTR